MIPLVLTFQDCHLRHEHNSRLPMQYINYGGCEMCRKRSRLVRRHQRQDKASTPLSFRLLLLPSCLNYTQCEDCQSYWELWFRDADPSADREARAARYKNTLERKASDGSGGKLMVLTRLP